LNEQLKDAGFEVVAVATFQHAVEQLDKDADYRALVTDINLGSELKGWDVARHARRLHPTLPVVYMTGDSAADWPVDGVPNSILVTKPFATTQIVTALGQLLNEGNTPGS
jgi:DNA-binding NtrC family response regulator